MKKLTLREMLLLARRRRGQCLSTVYVNSTTPLVWRCAAGHRWSAIPASIRKGSWCPECAGVRRINLDEMQGIASARGGRCLSDVCPNGATKLHWRCKEAHEWNATPSQIKKGHWCPVCARTVPLSSRVLRQMAASRGGECLSNKSVRSSQSALWNVPPARREYLRSERANGAQFAGSIGCIRSRENEGASVSPPVTRMVAASRRNMWGVRAN